MSCSGAHAERFMAPQLPALFHETMSVGSDAAFSLKVDSQPQLVIKIIHM